MDERSYISERLQEQIDWYDKKGIRSKKMFMCLRVFEIILSALIPVFVLLDYEWSKILAAIIGSFIVMSSGFMTLGKYHENWIEYRSVSEILNRERYLYETRSGVYADPSEPTSSFHLLVERIESITSHENVKWLQTHQKSNEKKET